MSYISTNHRGGIGNVMFKLAASISTAIDNNVDYLFSNEFIRPPDIQYATQGYPDYRVYYQSILRGIQFQDKLPTPYLVYTEPGFEYIPIPYEKGTNLLLDGGFQSERYFVNNKETIINLFKIPDHIEFQIKEAVPDINNFIAIHVRRGDYVNLPNHHPVQTREYYQKAVEEVGIDNKFLIFSDDLEGCKDMFDFIPTKYFYSTEVDWSDLYMMSICKDNIIANSSFSWWAAYLNANPNKKVIAPSKWFGSANAHLNTKDLIPDNWIKI
jgi:hypothetical protein